LPYVRPSAQALGASGVGDPCGLLPGVHPLSDVWVPYSGAHSFCRRGVLVVILSRATVLLLLLLWILLHLVGVRLAVCGVGQMLVCVKILIFLCCFLSCRVSVGVLVGILGFVRVACLILVSRVLRSDRQVVCSCWGGGLTMFCMTCATCSGVRVPFHPPCGVLYDVWGYWRCVFATAVVTCWDAPAAVAWLAVNA
jgi:hypothetical protein